MRQFKLTDSGFPFSLSRLKVFQENFFNAIEGIMTVAGDGSVPVILSGMEVSVTDDGTDVTTVVTEGWFYMQTPYRGVNHGEVFYFAGGAGRQPVGDTPVKVPYVKMVGISGVALPVANEDGSFPLVDGDITGEFSFQDPGLTDSPLLTALSFFRPFHDCFRELPWTNLGPVTYSLAGHADINGDLWIKKDRMANTVTIRYELTVNNFPAPGPVLYSTICTLPEGYRPSATFTDFMTGTITPSLLDRTSSFPVTVGWRLTSAGLLSLHTPESDGGADYTVRGQVTLVLD